MAQGLGINQVIDINTTIRSGGVGPADYGAGLLLVNDDTALAGAGSKKIRRFSSLSALELAFADATIRREAAIWFAADPSPKALYVARVVETNLATQGWSKALGTAEITALRTITGGTMNVNGHAVTGITPGPTATTDEIATAFETQLRLAHTSLSTSTVRYEPSTTRLHFTLQGASNTAVTAPMEVTNNTNTPHVGGILGFVTSEGGFAEGLGDTGGAYFRQGHVAQGVSQALAEVIGFASSGRPTNIMVSDTVSDSITAGSPGGKLNALRAFAQGGDYITAFVETNANTVFSNNDVQSTSQIGTAEGANQDHVMAIYSEPSTPGTSDRRVDIAVLAKLSAQNFDQPQSIITLVPKELPGVSPSNNVTSGQVEGLEAANASVYTTVGGYPSLLGGKVANGTWIDAQYWLGWLKNEMERNILNAIRQSNRLDNIELTDTIHKVMSKAINTGGIKLGGIVNTSIKKEIRVITNNPGFDGTLRNGYLLWIQPYSGLTDVDRGNRHQSFKVWISPSEAIHSVDGTIVLSG